MFPLPQGIPTFVTIPELRLLQRYAHDAGHVLEIGTQYGYTAIGMALAGAHVTSVDPHDQGPADNRDTWRPFLANCRRNHVPYDAWNPLDPPLQQHAGWAGEGMLSGPRHIVAYCERIEQWEGFDGWEMEPELVFIDGDHDYEPVRRDFEIAAAHLTGPRWVAFHDVTPRWPGVWRATQELEREGRMVKLEQAGFLAVYWGQ